MSVAIGFETLIGLWNKLIQRRCADYRQDQKVSFPKPLKDLDVDFSFSQQVHVLRQKSSQAHFILDNTIATLASL